MAILHWGEPQTPEQWERWNAKIVNKTKNPHVEIRTTRGAQDILIAVSLVGEMKFKFGNRPTDHCNIRISSNLPIKLTFTDWEDINKAIKEAIKKLKGLKSE
jgi:hypothetical protein